MNHRIPRAALAIVIALLPVLMVGAVALVTGYADRGEVFWAVVCTALLLVFAAHRRREWERSGRPR